MSDIEDAFAKLNVSSGSDVSQASEALLGTLAHASRSNANVRKRLADPQLLRTLAEVIESSINDSLETVDLALRCIGNACVEDDDDDSARAEITKNIGFSWALQCLNAVNNDSTSIKDNTTAMLTIKVLYNICANDYEPARDQCFKENVHYGLIQLGYSHSDMYASDAVLFVELLFWICSRKPAESAESDAIPPDTLEQLLVLPSSLKGLTTDDHALILEACLTFLRDERVQRALIETQQVQLIEDLLLNNENLIEQQQITQGNSQEVQALVAASVSLTWCLSDIAARPEFPKRYNISESEFIQSCVFTIQLQTSTNGMMRLSRQLMAACQVVGNVLWSMTDQERLSYLALEEDLSKPLLNIINFAADADLLHSAAGLLVQLSRSSPQVREAIGSETLTEPALERLCRHENPQVKQDGIVLLRTLGRDCWRNQARFAELAKEVMGAILTSSEDQAMAGHSQA